MIKDKVVTKINSKINSIRGGYKKSILMSPEKLNTNSFLPPISESLARELDEAILESEKPDAVFYTLDQIFSEYWKSKKKVNV